MLVYQIFLRENFSAVQLHIYLEHFLQENRDSYILPS